MAALEPHLTPEAVWRLSLLGGLRLEDGHQIHTRLATRAIVVLLVRLALWPQRDHAREELVELLWPGADLTTGRRRLRQALSLLKAVLEPPGKGPAPVLQADRLSIRVVAGSIACDVQAFEACARRGDGDGALDLYRGDLLPGYFDDWIHDERCRLEALHDRMLALAGSVERQVSGLVAVPERALARKRTARVAVSLASRRFAVRLPNYLTRYFDDDNQCARLLTQVRIYRLVTVQGLGGSGKTRLAVQAARQFQAEAQAAGDAGAGGGAPPSLRFETIVFVALAAAHTRDQLLTALCGALGIEPRGEALDAVMARLEGQQTLLVLDNAEQLVGMIDDVLTPLSATLPQLHLLVTSRCSLGLDGEREFVIAPMLAPTARSDLQLAAAMPAVAMFVDRARAVRLDFHLSERNHAAIGELIGALEGMPLAIELAASRVRSFSPAEMLARLKQPATAGGTPRLDLLVRTGSSATLQSRHASMQRVIDWSWQQLSPALRELAAAMTVFDGGCTASMLKAVHGGSADVRAGLEQLLAQSLCRASATDGGGWDPSVAQSAPRFRLCQPVHEYAAAQAGAEKALVWRARQRSGMIEWLRSLPLTPPLASVRAEMANLALSIDSAAADLAPEDAVQLVLAMQGLQEAVTLPAATLASAREVIDRHADPARQARGHSALALMLFVAGQSAQAAGLAEAALKLAPQRCAARAWALHAHVSVQWRSRLAEPQDFWPLLEEAQAIAEKEGDADLLASILSQQAFLLHARENSTEAALALHEQALLLWEAIGNRIAVNRARYNVAVFTFHVGRREEALGQWNDVATESEALQDWRRLATVNSARCAALSEMHRWPAARQALRLSLRHSWNSMSLYDLSYDLWNLPRVLAHLRQPGDAAVLAAFASQFWISHYGSLSPPDRHYLRLVDRLVARQLDPQSRANAAARGRRMSLAEAVALALEERGEVAGSSAGATGL